MIQTPKISPASDFLNLLLLSLNNQLSCIQCFGRTCRLPSEPCKGFNPPTLKLKKYWKIQNCKFHCISCLTTSSASRHVYRLHKWPGLKRANFQVFAPCRKGPADQTQCEMSNHSNEVEKFSQLREASIEKVESLIQRTRIGTD